MLVNDSQPRFVVKGLELAKASLFGSDVYCLMGSGANANCITRSLSDRMGSVPKMSSRRITTEMGDKSQHLGLIKWLPVLSDTIPQELDFLVVDNLAYVKIIGLPRIRRLDRIIDCRKQTFYLKKNGEEVVVALVTEYVRNERSIGGETDSEDFTSDLYATDLSSSSSSKSDGGERQFVVMFVEEDSDKKPRKEVFVEKKVSHLILRIRRKLKRILLAKSLIACSMNDVRPSQVPTKYSFELNNNEEVYHKPRHMSPKHNIVVKAKVELMLRAGVIKPISFVWY